MTHNAGRLWRRWSSERIPARVALAALGMLAAVLCGGSALAEPSAAAVPRIVPGESIGMARLGMSLRQASAVLGPGTAQPNGRWVFSRAGLVITFERGVAVRIGTTTAKYRTVTGAGVGITAADAPRLVGDLNSVTTTSGRDTTVIYAFRGIGFVFRGGRAVEAFIVESLAIGPRPSQAASSAPASPFVAPGVGAPPSTSTTPPAGAAPVPAPAGPVSVALRDVAATAPSTGGLVVTGTVANSGAAPVGGPLVVVATLIRLSGDQVEARTGIQGPIGPGASASFSVEGATGTVVARYQVAIVAANGASLSAVASQAVPPASYAVFAQQQIRVKVDLGAPWARPGPPTIQVLVSIADTGAIPMQWVRQVTVTLPYAAQGAQGSTTAQLRPGETQTVLVPAAATIGVPQVTEVVLGG